MYQPVCLKENHRSIYAAAITIVIIIIGKATLKNSLKDIVYPLLFRVSMAITFAEAPIIVPLPPKQAPNARHHHKKSILPEPDSSPKVLISGIMVATKGILSIKADNIAEIKRIARPVMNIFPWET